MISPVPWKHNTLFPARGGVPQSAAFRCVCIKSAPNSLTFGTALTPIHTEGMKGAQCSGTAFPARPRSSGCPHMTSAWFLSLPNGQSTNKCRVACHILSLDAPNRAIRLYSRHPQGIEKSELGEQSVWRQRDTTDCFLSLLNLIR